MQGIKDRGPATAVYCDVPHGCVTPKPRISVQSIAQPAVYYKGLRMYPSARSESHYSKMGGNHFLQVPRFGSECVQRSREEA